MDLLRAAVDSLAVLALLAATLQAYLILNKLWIRKHEPEVARSISIMGEGLGLVTMAVLMVHSMVEGYWAGVVDGLIWIVAGAVTVVVGTGMWVEGQRRTGFWRLFREALRLERREVGDLARSFFRPSGAGRILDILGQVALIDRHLDRRERAFIRSFADAWGVQFSWEDLEGAATGGDLDFVNLRRSLEAYLATSPPPPQVAQLGDVLTALVRIDEEVTSEEELILEELQGMLREYVSPGERAPAFDVAVVPQDPAKDHAIRTLLPGIEETRIHGGRAYLLGPFHSERYADIVAEQYRSLEFFTTVVRQGGGPEPGAAHA